MRCAAIGFAVCFILALGQASKSGDWYIGCEASSKYSDDRDKPDHVHVARRQDDSGTPSLNESPSKPNEDEPIPDFMTISSRCKPDGRDDTIETFNGTHWVDLYSCDPVPTCIDIHGHGACRSGTGVWAVPGKSLFTYFKCNKSEDSECSATGKTEPFRPPRFHNARTRCDPAGSKHIQYFDGQMWVAFYTCGSAEACLDENGRGICAKDGNAFAPHINMHGRARKASLNPVRCAPDGSYSIQYFDEPDRQWRHFHTCGVSKSGANQTCRNIDGNVGCWDGTTVNAKQDGAPPVRCSPDASGHLQVWNDAVFNWIDFGSCRDDEACLLHEGRTACRDTLGNIVLIERRLLDDTGAVQIRRKSVSLPHYQTRCDIQDRHRKKIKIKLRGDRIWREFYACHNYCLDIDGRAVCFEQFGHKKYRHHIYLTPTPMELHHSSNTDDERSDSSESENDFESFKSNNLADMAGIESSRGNETNNVHIEDPDQNNDLEKRINTQVYQGMAGGKDFQDARRCPHFCKFCSENPKCWHKHHMECAECIAKCEQDSGPNKQSCVRRI